VLDPPWRSLSGASLLDQPVTQKNLSGRAHRHHVLAVALIEHRYELGRSECRMLLLEPKQLLD